MILSVSTPPLIAARWTSAGDVDVRRGHVDSPVDIRTRIAAVADAGYVGMGLHLADLEFVEETIGLRELASLLADSGIRIVQLEWLSDWWARGPRHARSDEDLHRLLAASEILDAQLIKIGTSAEEVDHSLLCASLRDLADDAAGVGTMIAFEHTPYSYLGTLEAAAGLINDADHPRAGLLVDTWHVQRGGTSMSALTALLQTSNVAGIELTDGPAKATSGGAADTFDNRLYCGEGEFDVPAFIRAVRASGWTGAWGVEHMSAVSRTKPITEVLTAARQGALRCFDLADQTMSAPCPQAATTVEGIS